MPRLTRHDWAVIGWLVLAVTALVIAVAVMVAYDDTRPHGAVIAVLASLLVAGLACIGGITEGRRHGPGDHL